MKKIIFTSLLLLSLTNLIAQTNNLKDDPSAPGLSNVPKYLISSYKHTVVHNGVDGILVKGTNSWSTVDIDAPIYSESVIRLAKGGIITWGIGNGYGNDDFRIFEYGIGTPFIIKKNIGAVGIGTLSPSSRLEVSSEGLTDLRISSTAGFGATRLSLISDKGLASEWRPCFIQSSDNGTYTGRMDFYTNGTGAANTFGNVLGMTIMNKRVSIGNAFVSASPYALEIHGSSAYGFANFSSDNSKFWEQFTSTDGSLYLYGNGSYRGVFNSTTGAYTSVSDRSLKTNIISLTSTIDKVMALQPSSYEYIDNNPTNRKSIGLIAQDVEAIFPEFVYKNLDERTGKEVYTMDYAGMSVIALKAIQEQQVLIKELQAEIAKLKNK